MDRAITIGAVVITVVCMLGGFFGGWQSVPVVVCVTLLLALVGAILTNRAKTEVAGAYVMMSGILMMGATALGHMVDVLITIFQS